MKFEFTTFKTVASCSLMMFANFSLSAQETFKLNAEILKKVPVEKSNVFLVEYKEVEYYPLIDGKVLTESYKNFLDSQKDAKGQYSDAMSVKNKYDAIKDKKLKVVQLINEYFDSKNEKLLDEADKLSKELNLKFVIDNQSSAYNGWGVKPKKTLFIKNDNGKYASKTMLKEYLGALDIEIRKYSDYDISNIEQQYADSKQEEQEFSDDEKYEIGKVKSKNIAKRKIYVQTDEILVNSSELYGDYQEIAKIQKISNFEANSNIYKELVVSEKTYEETKYRKTAIDRLMKNINTGKLYYYPFDVISKINSEANSLAIEDYLVKNGYKIYENSNEKFFNTKHYKVPVKPILMMLIENDKNYFQNLDLRFEKMQALRKQALSYIPKFENYVRLYRLQRNRMSKVDISSWTTLTKSALNLNKQFVELNDKMWDSDYEILDKNYLKFSNEFDDYLGASMGVLGL